MNKKLYHAAILLCGIAHAPVSSVDSSVSSPETPNRPEMKFNNLPPTVSNQFEDLPPPAPIMQEANKGENGHQNPCPVGISAILMEVIDNLPLSQSNNHTPIQTEQQS